MKWYMQILEAVGQLVSMKACQSQLAVTENAPLRAVAYSDPQGLRLSTPGEKQKC